MSLTRYGPNSTMRAGTVVTTSDGHEAIVPSMALTNSAGVPLSSYNGVTASASFTPAAAAYSANDIMDVAKEFAFTYADGTAVPSGSLIRIVTTILKIDATALQTSEAGYSLKLYSVTPPSAQADNAAWSLASADLSAYRGSIDLGVPVDLGAALFIKTIEQNTEVKLTGTSLFGELQTAAGFTATAVARQVFLYGTVL
jgi:hypothetical protein